MYKPIRDYAIIGNRRSAALVAKNGSIDWAPAPYLDSASVFAAILDDKIGGFFGVRPTAEFLSTQEYVRETNVLVTTFTSKEGVVELTDCMPVRPTNGKTEGNSLTLSEETAIFEIYRKIFCKKGACEVKIIFQPKFDYARGETKLEIGDGIVKAMKEQMKGVLISSASYAIDKEGRAVATIRLQEGDAHYLAFRFNTTEIPSKEDGYYQNAIEQTKEFWKEWVNRCDLEVCAVEYPWHESVMRSSLVLKILFMEPPGSIAAAATTSLPEVIGGERNWDYRFSWLRDSAFALQALFWLGYMQEADEYVKWLTSECYVHGKDPAKLQTMYGLRGQKKLTEFTLPHLEGYRGSKPVRIGNAAYNQDQWDIYGGIMNMVWRLCNMRPDYQLKPVFWQALRTFADYVMEIWRNPDEGLWEVRGGKRHFTHSKVMCWVALDRAVKLAEKYSFDGNVNAWKKEKEFIKREVLEKGWSEKKQAFVQSFGSEDVDAAVLLLPVLGFIDGEDPRMVSTIAQIEKELSIHDGLFLRYKSPDGLQGEEGAFLLCSFWMVDALTFAGQKGKAQALFEQLLSYQNHLGLFSEEIDPVTKDFLGNFPQAYTHIGLISSAFYLSFERETLKKIVS